MTPGSAWCSLCLAPRGAAATETVPALVVTGAQVAAPVPTHLVQRTRFGGSETTFGLPGRIVMTILLLLPLGLFAFTLAVGFGIVGMGIWGLVVVPWGLRDIWKSSHRHGLQAAVPPASAAANRFGSDA